MYETVSHFSQIGGLVMFVAMFIVALAYALWPKNADTFRAAAHQPLIDKEPSDD